MTRVLVVLSANLLVLGCTPHPRPGQPTTRKAYFHHFEVVMQDDNLLVSRIDLPYFVSGNVIQLYRIERVDDTPLTLKEVREVFTKLDLEMSVFEEIKPTITQDLNEEAWWPLLVDLPDTGYPVFHTSTSVMKTDEFPGPSLYMYIVEK